jgi:DNA-directed RNA polymerase subunit omega
MIEALKGTKAMHMMGGRFKLSALIQKRMLELMQGGRPLIDDTEGKTQMEIVIDEILQGKITMDFEARETVELPKL